MICPEQFTLPAMSFAEQLLSIGQPVSKSSLQYMPLNFQSLVHGGSSYCLVLDVLIYVDVISNKQSIFSSQIRTLSFPINWPSLVSTARSPIKLYFWSKRLRINMIQINFQTKAFVICDRKSDQTRSATDVNKTYLVWLMFQVLSNQHYQYHTNQKLRSWANAVFQNRGVCGQASSFAPFPLPPHSFFLLSSQLSRQTRKRKRLLCRLDTHQLCTHLRTDGIKAMSLGFSGGNT